MASSCTEIKHDVFISFRGTDVRKGLLSHLKKELRRRQIDTYVDDRLDRGDEISPALLRAIEESQISLIIFSKDYASSKWCLEELAKIIECMERNKQIVLPVFFNVDPSHVRHQYGDALAKHEETLKKNIFKVQRWRSALEKAGHLSGFHYPTNFEDESDLVDKIVEDILEKLSKFCPSESDGLVGIDQNIAQIQSLLQMESSEVLFVGIWGMGGIGKTTIARAIFEKYSPQYEGCCFLNVREELEQQGLSLLRERLISELMEGGSLHSSGASKARFSNSAVRRMGRKKVLVVLDDVNTSEQLKYLVGERICFGAGSRVIITSRDKRVLTSGGVRQIHEVKEMNPRDSLKLFCLNAFNETQPKMGYGKLSDEIVKIAKGNPLALTVLGADFHSRSTTDMWECALSQIKKYSDEEIQRVLRFSYDGLRDLEKKAFLDIAFFYNEYDKDYVIRQLDACGFHGTSGIEVLQQKALITISNGNRIQMHDLLRIMGHEIVRQESIKYPGRRSRLKDSEDVYNVLRNKLGTDELEAMEIDVSKIADLRLSVDTFKEMPRLRFLKFNYPLHAELSMLQDIADSKRRDLTISNMLVELPQFSMGTNLECANLKSCDSPHDLVSSSSIQVSRSKQSIMELPEYLLECESLCDAHAPILSLQRQVASLLSRCKELVSVASEVHIKCLYYLFIDGCSSPKEFSVTSKETGQLNVTHHGMEILNSSIGCLSNLEGSDVEDQQFQNLPNELLCLRSSYYVKLSKSTGQDTGKPKLHILFDGLRFSQRISFDDLYYSVAVLQNISAFSWCRELIVEESSAGRLLEYLPYGTAVRCVRSFRNDYWDSMIHFNFIFNPYNFGTPQFYLKYRMVSQPDAQRYFKMSHFCRTRISWWELLLSPQRIIILTLKNVKIPCYPCQPPPTPPLLLPPTPSPSPPHTHPFFSPRSPFSSHCLPLQRLSLTSLLQCLSLTSLPNRFIIARTKYVSYNRPHDPSTLEEDAVADGGQPAQPSRIDQ